MSSRLEGPKPGPAPKSQPPSTPPYVRPLHVPLHVTATSSFIHVRSFTKHPPRASHMPGTGDRGWKQPNACRPWRSLESQRKTFKTTAACTVPSSCSALQQCLQRRPSYQATGNELYIRPALHTLRCFPMPCVTSALPHDSPRSARQRHHTGLLDGHAEAQSQAWNPVLSDASLPCSVTHVEGCGCKGCRF